MAETHHIDGIGAAVGSQFCSEWWQFGAPEERTCPLKETRIFIEQLERLPLQLSHSQPQFYG
jgi:hypothetical protein